MPKLTDEFFMYLMWGYFAVFAVAVYFQWRFRQRIKTSHPAIWRDLGNPGLLNNSVGSGLRFMNFTLRKRYETAEDPTLNFYGRGARLGFIAVAFCLCCFFVLIIFAQIQNGVLDRPAVVSGTPVTAISIIIFSVFILAFISQAALLGRLKKHHNEAWEELGQPSLFLNNTPLNNFKVLGFIWSGRFTKLHDVRLNCYAVASIISTITFCGLIILK